MTNWHQQNATRRAYKLRNKKAHICADDYIATGKMLCGNTKPLVTVLAKNAFNTRNNVCAKCLSALIKADLPLSMRTIEVCFADKQYNYRTNINGTRKTVCDYFRNARLNVGAFPAENMQTPVAIYFEESDLKIDL